MLAAGSGIPADVLLIDESTNLDKAGVGYLAELLAHTGKQTLLVTHQDELVAAMPQRIVVERASVPGYWSCFDCCSPSPDSGAFFGWPATVSVSCSPGFGACSSAWSGWSGRSCVDSLTATSSVCGHRTLLQRRLCRGRRFEARWWSPAF